MLSIFRSNQITVIIPLALYLVVVHLCALTGYIQAPVQDGSSAGLLYVSLFSWLDSFPFWSAVSAVSLVFLQSILVNFLADEHRLMGDRNWYPGLFYALIASALPDFQFLSPVLVGATFVPLSLGNVFKSYQKPGVTGYIFDAGFWLGVATLFYPGAFWLALAGFAGLSVVRIFRLSEMVVYWLGIVVPGFLAWVWYFWTDRGDLFRAHLWNGIFQFFDFELQTDQLFWLKAGLMAFLGLVFMYGLATLSNRKGILIQKFISVLYWYLAVGTFMLLLHNEWQWYFMLAAAAPMALLLARTFGSMRSVGLASVWHWFLLLCVAAIQLYALWSPLVF